VVLVKNILRPQAANQLIREKVNAHLDGIFSEDFAEEGLEVRDLALEFRDAHEKLVEVGRRAGNEGNS